MRAVILPAIRDDNSGPCRVPGTDVTWPGCPGGRRLGICCGVSRSPGRRFLPPDIQDAAEDDILALIALERAIAATEVPGDKTCECSDYGYPCTKQAAYRVVISRSCSCEAPRAWFLACLPHKEEWADDSADDMICLICGAPARVIRIERV